MVDETDVRHLVTAARELRKAQRDYMAVRSLRNVSPVEKEALGAVVAQRAKELDAVLDRFPA